MALDIRDFSMFADGEDFQPAFRAALVQLEEQGGGELVIPVPSSTDTYWIGQRDDPESGLDFTGITVPITIRGEGRRSRIGMLPRVGVRDFHMFHFHGNNSIRLDSLCLFGNKDAFVPPKNEQTHLVEIRHSSDISFTNVWFEESVSSGIKMGAIKFADEEGSASDRIQIMGCHFLHNGRQNILIREGARRVWITNNYFDGGGGGSQIHFEPSDAPGDEPNAAQEIIIAHNHIRNRILVDGEWVPNADHSAINLENGRKLTVIGNHMEGGGIYGANVQEAAIIGNHIDGVDCPRPGIHIFRAGRDISIVGNWVRVKVPEPAVKLEQNAGLAPENVIIANNPHLEGRTGINVVGACRRIKIHDNMIFGNSHSARDGGVGVNIDANTEQMGGINIHDNYIKGFPTGVQLARETIDERVGRIDRVRIRSNDIEDFTDKYEGVEVHPPNEFIEILEFVP
jgi:hypothetical protein